MKFKFNERDEIVLCENESNECHDSIDTQEIINNSSHNECGIKKMKSEFISNGVVISKNKKFYALRSNKDKK